MPDKIFFDTNILVYLSSQESPFHLRVLEKVKELFDKYEIWISRQVLREYAVVMTNSSLLQKPLSSDEVEKDMEKWGSIFRVADEIEETTKYLRELIVLFDVKGKNIHDANIIATMKTYNIERLFTLNLKDFKRFNEIKLIQIE
ncbi:MAG: type II toxin-antitoxin system VapC family toxin [Ignavibacteriaceae bacterium]